MSDSSSSFPASEKNPEGGLPQASSVHHATHKPSPGLVEKGMKLTGREPETEPANTPVFPGPNPVSSQEDPCITRKKPYQEPQAPVSPVTDPGFTVSAAPLLNPATPQASSKPNPLTPTPNQNVNRGQSAPRLGRFLVQKELGRGAYGTVYLCFDEQLDRRVAIKVPHPENLQDPDVRRGCLKEAQVLARMEHPAIVEVLEISETPFFLVSNFIEGMTLEARMGEPQARHARMPFAEIAQMVETLALGLQHAHSKGLVHRDLKPANILLDTAGKPHIADFGMALHDDDFGKGIKKTGTPLYNSPEQARSEGHRVDGRSDLFSLGIILYELLTGKHPFLRGKPTREELFQVIIHEDPKPLQQWDGSIPRTLAAICTRCLAKDVKERYQSGQELAEDLAQYRSRAGSSAQLARLKETPLPEGLGGSTPSVKTLVTDLDRIRIVPKGLRSFDEEDSSFFLALLPGVRGLDDLPESIRYWKSRIERKTDSFSVGLIYGPSGCGKSSLVRAGLLPHLDPAKIASVYVEAAPGQTETRLLGALRKLAVQLPEGTTLKDAAIAIRKGRAGVASGKKILIVLDQFEQWLHERQGEFPGDLADALRQFDGVHAQCILLVRDDFSMPIARFMKALQIDLVSESNYQVVDLFDKAHANRLLRALGRAYGQLPEFPEEPTATQKVFLRLAVEGLAQENRVISVRLALFTQMMKSRSWTPESLEEVGGVEGLGISFLEETFVSKSASPEYRFHQKAVRGVLKSLLPEAGTDIKGRMRSREELQQDSGYGGRPLEFDALLRILDRELRLITPTDAEVQDESESANGIAFAKPRENPDVPLNLSSTRYYQLAHDYLVPSIRAWLLKKQKETAKGRAEILLEERAALWKDQKQTRQLPSLPEYLRIAWHTKPFERTPTQKEMVKQAGWFHGVRSLVLVILLGFLGFGGYEGYQRFSALKLVDTLAKAEPGQIESLVKQIELYGAWADGRLETIRQTQAGTTQAFAASIALLPRRPQLVGELVGLLNSPTVDNDRFAVLAGALRDHSDPVVKTQIWANALAEKDDGRRFRLAGALAMIEGPTPEWDQLSVFVASHLVKLDATNYLFWRDRVLSRVGSRLIPTLSQRFRDSKAPEQVRSFAAEAVITYGKDQPAEVFDLMADSPALFYPGLQKACLDQDEGCVNLAKEEIAKPIPDKLEENQKDAQARRKANSAIFLLKANQANQNLWDLWKLSPDPRIRSEIIHDCPLLEINPAILIKRLEQEKEISTRRALVLSLGSYPASRIPESDKTRLSNSFLQDFARHTDGGYHSALEWTLRRWGQEKKVDAILKDLAGKYPKNPNEEKEWLVTPTGITMMVIKSGPFTMGSPETEPGHQSDETLKPVKISQSFLLASHEITRGLYRKFENDIKLSELQLQSDDVLIKPYSKTQDDPQTLVSWFQAAHFCNWLSEKEGIPKDQWCYEPVKVTDPKNDTTGGYREGMVIKANHRELAGYRLPLESEWEYACRATTKTSRYYGNRVDLLGQYAWYGENSTNHLWPVQSLKPNDWGLFDMMGNALEWCQEASKRTNTEEEIGKISNGARLLRGGSFGVRAMVTRSAYRTNAVQPDIRGLNLGFRPCRTYDLKILQIYNKKFMSEQ